MTFMLTSLPRTLARATDICWDQAATALLASQLNELRNEQVEEKTRHRKLRELTEKHIQGKVN